MTYPSLELVSALDPGAHVVCVTDMSAWQRLEDVLTEQEFLFLKRGVSEKVKQYLFPRGLGSIIVRIIPQKTDHCEEREAARLAGNGVLTICAQYKIKEICVASYTDKPIGVDFLEGLLLGNYAFTKYYSKEEKRSARLQRVSVVSPMVTAAQLDELRHLTEAVYITRSLVNEPFGTMDTLFLREEIQKIGMMAGFKVESLGKEQIQAMRMGGILAVNQASDKPPHFHILEWNPKDAVNKKPLVLVGKGVVFDTGGLSLKSADSLETMKCDMAGAAVVIGALMAAAKNQLPVHIIGLIPATDNIVSHKALVPGDVIRMYSGTTVEVVNTDAEGRLILADALHYAKKLDPDIVIDFATLTGAAVRALGSHAICYMGNADREVKQTIETCGWNTYERLVELPLWSEYGDELKSNIADMKNLGSSYAGMITAGKFLEHFTDYPWLHLDIAGPAFLKSAQGYRPKDGTGVGVRLIYDFIKAHYCTHIKN